MTDRDDSPMEPCMASCPQGECANCIGFDRPSARAHLPAAPMQPAKRGGGIRRDGVRTIDDLMARCRIDDLTGCWLWAGAKDGNGRPSLWLPVLSRRVSLGVAICVLRTGKAPGKGVVWHCTCTTTNCANPRHRTAGNRSSQMLAARIRRSAATRAKIAAGKRAVSPWDESVIADVRSSSEPLHAVAARHGMSIEHASNIRRGESRLELGVRGASVFNLGAQA